jgi:hypothetical protein
VLGKMCEECNICARGLRGLRQSEARSHPRKAHVSAGIDMRKVRFDLTRAGSRVARDVRVSRGTKILLYPAVDERHY